MGFSGQGWGGGLEMYLVNRGRGERAWGLSMCAFSDQGFGKGFEEEQTVALRAQGAGGSWGRGRRGRPQGCLWGPQGGRCSGPAAPGWPYCHQTGNCFPGLLTEPFCPKSQALKTPG